MRDGKTSAACDDMVGMLLRGGRRCALLTWSWRGIRENQRYAKGSVVAQRSGLLGSISGMANAAPASGADIHHAVARLQVVLVMRLGSG
jgi:hypothetical protein